MNTINLGSWTHELARERQRELLQEARQYRLELANHQAPTGLPIWQQLIALLGSVWIGFRL